MQKFFLCMPVLQHLSRKQTTQSMIYSCHDLRLYSSFSLPSAKSAFSHQPIWCNSALKERVKPPEILNVRAHTHIPALRLNGTEFQWKFQISVGLDVNPHPIMVQQEHTTYSVLPLMTLRSLLSLPSSTRLYKRQSKCSNFVEAFHRLM